MRHIRISIISIILILIFSTILTAQSKSYSLNIKPYFGLNSGKTEYIMDINEYFEGFTYIVKSQLEYPLDQTMFGGELELKLLPGSPREWAFNFAYYTNLSDPSGKMYDHDWWNFRTGIVEKISYTESDAEGKNNIFLVEIDKLILIGKKGSISLSGGFRYQKIEQDIFGFKGWQLDQDGVIHEFEDPETNGLYYKITYKLPNAGFKINYFINQQLTFQSRIAYSRAYISDFDHHILRFKTSESDLNGNGLLVDFAVRMDFGSTPGKGLFVELDGNLTNISGSGTSTQTWYDDDPAGEGDETGLSVLVPHEINTTQFRFGIAVGLGL